MWRSEEMSYMRMFVPGEAAHAFVDEIGRRGIMQFVDLNKDMQAFQRAYIRDITAINEVQRKLSAVEGYLDEYAVPHEPDTNFLTCEPVTKEAIDAVVGSVKSYHARLLNDFQVAQQFRQQLQHEHELDCVLDKFQHIFGRQMESDVREQLMDSNTQERGALLADVENARGHVAFLFIGGVVSKSQKPTFERQVYLTSRGNMYTIFADLPDQDKEAFVVFFLGENLDKKLHKLCQVMSINVYLSPEDQNRITSQLEDSRSRQEELRDTLYRTETQLRQDLFKVSTKIGTWKRILDQGKYIYSILNQFRVNESAQMLQVEGWVPSTDQLLVRESLRIALDCNGFSQGSHPSVVQEIPFDASANPPPTFFRLNKFTSMYQEIVNTYGIPRYGEINPGFLTIVTFPFLFGVMYGDVFHGSILFLFSLLLIAREKEMAKGPMNEFLSAAFHGRYMLVMMGFFATYCGFIYNDFTSLSLRLFATRWDAKSEQWTGQDDPYPFGVDWSWYGATDELAYLNSLKMKLSIIIGVTQMTMGIFLSLFNHIHFRDVVSVVFDFIPQITFMLSFFGYMVFIILRKWCLDWGAPGFPTHDAPNLIKVLIDMVLGFGKVDSFPLYEGQETMQAWLLVLMLVSVPWMLLPKPFVLQWLHRRRERLRGVQGEGDADYRVLASDPEHVGSDDGSYSAEETHEEFEMSEVFVHQVIHTIEFVLGCVSNTASYLRLWALSLAHAQLAQVFYEKLLSGNFGNVMSIFIGFGAFAGATFAVLLAMDVLECFLHALRLHWVEFQNKFYNADGIPFEPVSFELLAGED